VTPAAIVLTPTQMRVGVLLVSYLLGATAFGPRKELWRGREAIAGVATAIWDAVSGLLAVWIAEYATGGNIHWMTYAALAVILGQMFPIWRVVRGKQGGQGVAVAAGAFSVICWQAMALDFALWIVVVWFWGYASVGSLASAAALPLLLYLLYAPGHAPPTVVSAAALLVTALVVVKHRASIERLLAGTEPRFSLRKPKA
jgi:acyl phosphate:glycerol-3-phosphate acyltransferase